MTDANPYQPPQSGSHAPSADRPPRTGPSRVARIAAFVSYPLPFAASFSAWFAWPIFFFSLPIPVVQAIVMIAAIGFAVLMTRTLFAGLPGGAFLSAASIALYVLAILVSPSLALETYAALGFREPFP